MAGGVVTIAGGNVIHTFNSSGYLTPLTLFTRSLRFRSSASAYLNRTFGAGSQTTWTFSAWFKLGTLSVDRTLFSCGSGATDSVIYINSANTLFLNLDNATKRQSTLVLRDPSAWYHLVVPLDTTNGTAQNRIRAYLNGVEITAWIVNTTVALNATPSFNSAIAHNISRYIAGAGIYFDGYMAEVNFVDGQALTPSSFGTVNSYGVWQPITYGGSYGTNGFRLPFTNNASTTTLGYDFSPQGNNWTTNNISVTAGSTYDSMTDVPTLTSATAANYCVLNPLSSSSSMTITSGNLNITSGVAPQSFNAYSSMAALTGKFYAEVRVNTGGVADMIGVCPSTLNAASARFDVVTGGVGYASDGKKYVPSGSSAYGATYTSGDIIGIALDMDAQTVTFYKNNTSQGVISSAFTANVAYYFATTDADGSVGINQSFNFGQQPFTYTPPSGFLALNTFNL
jgi:hypothetical protein